MSAAFTETLMAQLRAHMDGAEAASNARYHRLETDTAARIARLEEENARLEKELEEEKGTVRQMRWLMKLSTTTLRRVSAICRNYQELLSDDLVLLDGSPNRDESPGSALADLPSDDAASPEDMPSADEWRRERAELERLRTENGELKRANVGVVAPSTGSTILQSPRITLESIVYVARVLADRHHFGTLASLNITCRLLREETTPILERTLVLDGENGWWTGSYGSFDDLGNPPHKAWPHTEFVISDNRAVYLRSEKLFPNLRVHIVKQREEPDRYFTGAHSTHSHTGPNAMCDIVIRRDVSTSDLAYLLSTSLRWQHNGTGFQVPVRRVRRITVDPGAAVTEACSPQKSQDFKLDGFANTFMFHYRDERASERLSRTMIILDRLFVRDSSHKTHVALEDGTAIFDTYLNTVRDRLQRGLLADLKITLSVRFGAGCHSHEKRESVIKGRAEAIAWIYQRHWGSLPQYSTEPTPARTTITPIGQVYQPDPFLSVDVTSDIQVTTAAPFKIQLHQKGNDLTAFWLDVLEARGRPKDAGEVETGEPGQEYTRPGAVVHKRYPVTWPASS